jgi:hypothetical protein
MVDFVPPPPNNFISQVMSVTFFKINLCQDFENMWDNVEVTGQANEAL